MEIEKVKRERMRNREWLFGMRENVRIEVERS